VNIPIASRTASYPTQNANGISVTSFQGILDLRVDHVAGAARVDQEPPRHTRAGQGIDVVQPLTKDADTVGHMSKGEAGIAPEGHHRMVAGSSMVYMGVVEALRLSETAS
jgi:hypothetical protein